MKTATATVAIGAFLGLLAPAWAQDAAPAAPLRPASAAAAQPDAARMVYDESADAKRQIADALAKAKKENRRVLIQWGGNWCPWCIKLHELCKSDKAIAKELLYEYDVVYVDAGKENKNVELAATYGADLKKHGYPFLTILDGDGKAIANQETASLEKAGNKLENGHNPAAVLDFLTKYQAAPLEAAKVLEAGLAEAKKTDRIVFLHLGAPWCGWCHRLEAWMARPEIKAVLDKQFVDVKIDIDRMKGVKGVREGYNKTEGGIPWFALLSADGKTLADSDGPDGNVGFPYQPNEVEYFAAMLKKAAPKLSAADIEALVASLNKNRESEKDGG
jgi:thioredoxin-related protein